MSPPDMPVLWVLRDVFGLTGTKFGCVIAACGACTASIVAGARASNRSPAAAHMVREPVPPTVPAP